MKRLFLGLDTSNYTTSAALCSEDSVLFNQKRLLTVAEGQRGLRQQEAVFQHIKNLPEVFAGIDFSCGTVSAVGASTRPRNMEGSYMPCFTVGESFAEVVAGALGVPVYSFSHQQGHIAAGLSSVGRKDLLKERFLAFHLSGGTCELLLVDGTEVVSVLASSDDITFGQLIDRTGVLLGLRFPCGVEMDRLFSADAKLPEKPRFSFRENRISLSGFENKILSFIDKGLSPEEIVRYVFEVTAVGISEMIIRFAADYADLPLLFTGGVSSNGYLRRVFGQNSRYLFADPAYSCDNAAGVAVLAAICHRKDGV